MSPVVLVHDTDAQTFLYRFPGRNSIRLISNNEASTSNQAAPPAGRRPCPFCGTWSHGVFVLPAVRPAAPDPGDTRKPGRSHLDGAGGHVSFDVRRVRLGFDL